LACCRAPVGTAWGVECRKTKKKKKKKKNHPPPATRSCSSSSACIIGTLCCSASRCRRSSFVPYRPVVRVPFSAMPVELDAGTGSLLGWSALGSVAASVCCNARQQGIAGAFLRMVDNLAVVAVSLASCVAERCGPGWAAPPAAAARLGRFLLVGPGLLRPYEDTLTMSPSGRCRDWRYRPVAVLIGRSTFTSHVWAAWALDLLSARAGRDAGTRRARDVPSRRLWRQPHCVLRCSGTLTT